ASASLIPADFDPSALFTVAGMHPLKPYFQGVERPPHSHVTTCQKTFRTADIDIIGTTTRHLTFFEMLGNFSFGYYSKRESARFAWELSTGGFGFRPDFIFKCDVDHRDLHALPTRRSSDHCASQPEVRGIA